jgi:pyruvate dehydrogenase E1 component alpha subunit
MEVKVYNPCSESEALEIYRKLSLIRQCQEVIIKEYPNDEIKTPVHLGIGMEGISVGVAHCLPPNTKSFGQLRNHGQYLAVTGETDEFFGELYGKITGTGSGKAGSMHLSSVDHGLMSTSGIVASTIPLAVGAAFAAIYRGTDDMAVAMFGDAAVEEGEFWESLNFACLHRLRVLFVCEENDLAIHTVAADRRGFQGKCIASAVRGFDCYVFEGDGTDVRNVIDIVGEAINLMAHDPKPAFLSLRYFRFLEHVGPNSDFDVGYRPRPTESELKALDPVLKFEEYLLSIEVDESQLRAVREDVAAQIKKSVEAAWAADYPTGEDLLKAVFS